MFNNLDIVLSFATIMLGVSLLIMVLTQTVSTVLNLRGRNLLSGLVTLFAESGIGESVRADLAKAILEHPLLADGAIIRRMAPAIRKEELLAMFERMKTAEKFKNAAAELENAKQRIETWFQSCMDRVSHKFAGWMRLTTVLFSFAMAFGLRLDSLKILGELSSDPALRSSLAGLSENLLQRAKDLSVEASSRSGAADGASDTGAGKGTAAPGSTATPTNTTGSDGTTTSVATAKDIAKLVADAKGIAAEFEKTPFQLLPTADPTFDFWDHIWGMLVSAVLLSLGAPFWFNILGVASSLRPVLATKVDQQPEVESP